MNVCEYCGEQKAKKRFCNRSCSNAWQHANGVRRTYVNDKTTWDWWVRKHGIDEALRLKECHRQASSIAMSGKRNPMYGRHDHVHGLRRMHAFRKGKTWEDLLGDTRASELRTEYSQRCTGAGNPSYGKVYDRGGKSKIQGVYLGLRFRSSYELSWLVSVLADGAQVCIPKCIRYIVDGKQRTYFPDFQINNIVFEIKPSALVCHASNIHKIIAAQEFCTSQGLEYKIVTEHDIKLLTLEQISMMINVEWNKGTREYIDEQMQNYRSRRRRSNG